MKVTKSLCVHGIFCYFMTYLICCFDISSTKKKEKKTNDKKFKEDVPIENDKVKKHHDMLTTTLI